MEPIASCHAYFDAWIRRDADAMLSTFARGGTYRDPTTPGPIAGDALRGYAQRLWSAFPDLSFELGPVHRAGDHEVHAQWTMTGTNTGSLNGLPPTGKSVRVPGIDVIETGPDGIVGVTGYFDSAAVPRQLGLDVIVQPSEIGPFRFGTSTLVRTGKAALPGCVAITELIARDVASAQRVRETAREVVVEALQQVPGFLWFSTSSAGTRMTTVSMWDSIDSMRRAMHDGTHAQAMRDFYDYADSGITSVYTPVRVGPYLHRCTSCGAKHRLAGRSGRCDCGAALAVTV
jgi:steroid delta-isomerase-like uncharacterized protein